MVIRVSLLLRAGMMRLDREGFRQLQDRLAAVQGRFAFI
jgi:hypothetical protein